MRNFRTLTIEELQSYARSGDDEAVYELGKRIMDMPINDHDSQLFCQYRIELEELQSALDIEIPLDCPHCGGWLTDV